MFPFSISWMSQTSLWKKSGPPRSLIVLAAAFLGFAAAWCWENRHVVRALLWETEQENHSEAP